MLKSLSTLASDALDYISTNDLCKAIAQSPRDCANSAERPWRRQTAGPSKKSSRDGRLNVSMRLCFSKAMLRGYLLDEESPLMGDFRDLRGHLER